MTDKEKVELYDLLIKKEYHNKELEPVIECFSYIVNHSNDCLLRNNGYVKLNGFNVSDTSKKLIIDRLFPIIKRINDYNLSEQFRNVTFYALDSINISGGYIPEFLMMVFFPQDCFKFDNINQEERKRLYDRYLHVTEQLMIYKSYYCYDTNSKLLKDFNITLDYIFHLDKRDEYNAFLPSILLYSLINNCDKDRLMEMIKFSFDNYDELINYIDLNDDDKHNLELYYNVMNKITEGNNNKQIIR